MKAVRRQRRPRAPAVGTPSLATQSPRGAEIAPTGRRRRVAVLTMNRPLLCMLLALAALAGGLALSPPATEPGARPARPRITPPAELRSPLSIAPAPPVDAEPVLALEPVGPLPDPDRVGPCPEAYAHLRVERRGLDEEGRPTWWHADGSVTKRIVQRVRGDGREVDVPGILRLTPRDHFVGGHAVAAQPVGSSTSR